MDTTTTEATEDTVAAADQAHRAHRSLWSALLCRAGYVVGVLAVPFYLLEFLFAVLGIPFRQAKQALTRLAHSADARTCTDPDCENDLHPTDQGRRPPPILGESAHNPAIRYLYNSVCQACADRYTAALLAGGVAFVCRCGRFGVFDAQSRQVSLLRAAPGAPAIFGVRVPVCRGCGEAAIVLTPAQGERAQAEMKATLS